MKRNHGPRARDRKSNGGVLADSNIQDNGEISLNSSSDEEVLKRHKLVQRRKSFIEMDKGRQRDSMVGSPRPGSKRKSVAGDETGGDLDSSEGDRGSDYENHAGGRSKKRIRRRKSKRLDDGRNNANVSASALNMSYGNLNISVASASVATSPKRPTDRKTLQEIYSTCSALFQAHKITPQNAFSLKLVECLDEIIESEDFDKRNLPLLARTLEIGGKIYVCRVDCTHAHTIKLAGEITAHQNEAATEDEEGPEDVGEQADVQEEAEGRKKNRVRLKKRSRFIEDNEAKLNTRFEDQSSKYASRRTSLKSKLHKNIDEELDFDYLSYFLKPEAEHPLETEEEHIALSSKGHVPDSHVNEDEIKDIPWLPFNAMNDWDHTKVDIWGLPLASGDPMDLSSLQGQTPCVANNDDEFAYNPDNRPEEYPIPEGDDNGPDFPPDNDDMENYDDMPEAVNRGDANASQPLAVDNLKSLDDLRRFFTSLKGAQLVLKNKYGWAGPVFLKPHRLEVKRKTDDQKKEKQQRKKKVMILNYDEVDWKDATNKYLPAGIPRTTVDEKTLSKWSLTKTVTPYCSSQNFLGYDEDEEEYRSPFDASETTDDPMANIIRFFIDTNRNIFKLMEEEFKEGRSVLSQSMMGSQALPAEDDVPDMDIEAPRDYLDDSIGNLPVNPEVEPGVEGGMDEFAAAGMNLSAMFPGSLLGFDTNDPMSRASEFDSVKFSKQPKPIDMHALKVVIRKILMEKLQTDDEGKPTLNEDTRLDLLSLITEMMKRVDNRMAKHMSMAIIIVGLMHVVADNKFFMVSDMATSMPENPFVVCRGLTWKHKEHIPMGEPCPPES